MRRLDLLIYQQVLQRRRQPAGVLDPFKGLVLSEEEIDGILAESTRLGDDENPPNSADPNFRTLHEALGKLEAKICERRAASLRQNIFLFLPYLSEVFHLTAFEEQCLIICLAPELDKKYEKLYAYLQDDITCKKPSIGLVLDLLRPTFEEKIEARVVFNPQAPLLKYRLLQLSEISPDGSSPFPSRLLKLDDRIVDFILGLRPMDARLASVARIVSSPIRSEGLTLPEEVQARIRSFVCSHFDEASAAAKKLVFCFHGPYGSGKRSLAEAVCHDLGFSLIIADLSKMVMGRPPLDEISWLLGREAVLQPAALCLEGFDCLLPEDEKNLSHLRSIVEMIQTFCRLTFICSSRAWKPKELLREETFIDLKFNIPDEKARKKLWERHFNSRLKFVEKMDVYALASQFRFTGGQMEDALVAAQNLAKWRSPGNGRITLEDLYLACKLQSNSKLNILAQKIKPKFSWDDIVLPPDQLAQLREICHQAKYRHIVYGEWGFERKLSLGKGLNVLFYGPSGTGKTMAAEVIAHELHLDLYKIDLSQVVSKYIGETEKNLQKVFQEAQTSNAILFFDEADALFGKRSEVKDAHDRYANIEIGYLLQKMEEYEGITILATNLRHHIDEAFVRRIQMIVEFPFPDEAYRRAIWQVVFPREAPLGDDVDLGLLAREVSLAGGHIKNIALASAFYAAEKGDVIRMVHLLRSARREYQKLGRAWDGTERYLQNPVALEGLRS
jgi:SpoVK/Ycf46/Vps4 family AAA+-type ATPase